MRSRVTENCWPTSSRVWSVFMPMPKRMRNTRSSRAVSEASTRVVVSRRLAWIAASSGSTAFLSSMKSPRCESSSSPIGVSRLIGSLAIFSTLRTFSKGMPSFSASSSGVGDRARDRLADPPRRIGREFVAAAVLELIDRLHQADIAFLDEVEELQAAIGVFLGDRDDEAEIGLDHLLLRPRRLALAALHRADDAPELADRQTGLGRGDGDLTAQLHDVGGVLLDEIGPAAAGQLLHRVEPVRRQLVAEIILEELLALDAAGFGEAQHAALDRHQAAVEVVKLIDEELDAGVVEAHALHLLDHLGLELVVALLGRLDERLALLDGGEALILQLVQLLVEGGDGVEGLEHLRLERKLHGGERDRALLALGFLAGKPGDDLAFGARLDFGRRGAIGGDLRRGGGRRRPIAVASDVARLGEDVAAIGGVEVDDVAQQHLALEQGF